jgi:hypothetical protein
MLRIITPQDIDPVCSFAAEVFCSYEPMCKALQPTVAQFVQQFRPVLEACCSSSLSFVLEAQGSMLSLSLALSFAAYNAVQLTELPTFSPVLALFDDLVHPCEKAPGAVLNFIWATHRDHMNKGYAKRVIEGTAQAARAAGCTCLVTDATNVVSQHLLPIFGYEPVKKVSQPQGPTVLARCLTSITVYQTAPTCTGHASQLDTTLIHMCEARSTAARLLVLLPLTTA